MNAFERGINYNFRFIFPPNTKGFQRGKISFNKSVEAILLLLDNKMAVNNCFFTIPLVWLNCRLTMPEMSSEFSFTSGIANFMLKTFFVINNNLSEKLPELVEVKNPSPAFQMSEGHRIQALEGKL